MEPPEICYTILKTINSKVINSHTANRVNILNKIPISFKAEVNQLIARYGRSLRNTELSLEEVLPQWRSFLDSHSDLKDSLDGKIEQVEDELMLYYKLLLSHIEAKYRPIINDNEHLDCLIKLIPTGNITCQDMANWALVQLLSSDEIEEPFKRRIRLINNGRTSDGENSDPHMFVAIMDWTGEKIGYVVDPWLKYLNVNENAESVNGEGLCGTFDEFKDKFNQFADDFILKKIKTDVDSDTYINGFTEYDARSVREQLENL